MSKAQSHCWPFFEDFHCCIVQWFNVHNLYDGVLFSCHLSATALVLVLSQGPSCSTLCLEIYKTDNWVEHLCQPRFGNRLQNIAWSSTVDANETFIIFCKEQTYNANLNTCICQKLHPKSVLNWQGSVLVMKVNEARHNMNCNEADILPATEAVKQLVFQVIQAFSSMPKKNWSNSDLSSTKTKHASWVWQATIQLAIRNRARIWTYYYPSSLKYNSSLTFIS